MSHSFFSKFQSTLSDLSDLGLFRHLFPISSINGPFLTSGPNTYLNFASNDYLGLSQHPSLSRGFSDALSHVPLGSGSSRLICGTFDAHLSFEKSFSTFKSAQRSLLFPSGYQANISAVTTFADAHTIVYSDASNHASLVDACRLSRARVRIFRHLDTQHLQSLILNDSRCPDLGRYHKIVLTDSVFSTDGSVSDIRLLRDICDAHQALLFVDEAHATGVIGTTGSGLCGALGIQPDLQVSTLSKAFGLWGGVISTSTVFYDLLINRGRSFIFSTAPSPALSVAALRSLEIISSNQGHTLRKRLIDNVSYLLTGLRSIGWQPTSDSHIVSVVLKDPKLAVTASRWLLDRGLFVLPLRPPTVPIGRSLLRISPTALHENDHLDRLLDVFSSLYLALPDLTRESKQ
jgi:8-amino-7-oxononanoate synthase